MVASGWINRLFAILFTAPLWSIAVRARSAGELAAIVAFGAAYVFTYGWVSHRGVAARAWCCVAVTALAGVVVLGHGHHALCFSFPVALFAIMMPGLWAVAAAGSLAAAVVVADSLLRGSVDAKLMMMLVVVLTALAIHGFLRLTHQLRTANATIARLAVDEDRRRLARDLHDSVGSSLTTISVKAGLVRRLLEEGAHDKARTEVADVERLSRQALHDVRSSVAGNHALSLAGALTTARDALVAAGITPDLPREAPEVPVTCEQIFAYTLLEGVTNVIRHSGAGRCRVRLGPTFVEIRDDGVGHADGAPGTGQSLAGQGLTGLAGRLAAIGGTLEAGPVARGYRLRAECPQ
ncbi:sensor histidine kinase [Nonomuraea sp. SBT364]|uniref:sensor histidine kinase n=1 Tax=Nonomuraea sp. SBT364 TaxID=1580530 RepID=UPI000ACBCA3E|nr:histidine kinase [Nonomuraea sp. SBT364]